MWRWRARRWRGGGKSVVGTSSWRAAGLVAWDKVARQPLALLVVSPRPACVAGLLPSRFARPSTPTPLPKPTRPHPAPTPPHLFQEVSQRARNLCVVALLGVGTQHHVHVTPAAGRRHRRHARWLGTLLGSIGHRGALLTSITNETLVPLLVLYHACAQQPINRPPVFRGCPIKRAVVACTDASTRSKTSASYLSFPPLANVARGM